MKDLVCANLFLINLKKSVKNIFARFWPGLFQYIRSIRIRIHFRKAFGKHQKSIRSKLYGQDKIRILSGPFKGVSYIDGTVWGPITPKWIGSYEKELHRIIEDVIQKNKHRRIIDIGSAEGYYVAGLGTRMPNAIIYSFDVDPVSRKQQRKLISINSLKNVNIKKLCTHQELNHLIQDRTFIIVDIEGYEFELLDPVKASNLKMTDILVELHSFGPVEDMEKVMRDRFRQTHDIQKFRETDIDIEYYNTICRNLLTREELIESTKEYRHGTQSWLWMQSIR